ncbi:MAG: geranylgeranyl pyrophosphate synthetase [Cirrosporium novae-zelandiae]|nr:MAG: geranylgeranyl pyrophosphate synthetase [Cirrosporium novae-zelandiae]
MSRNQERNMHTRTVSHPIFTENFQNPNVIPPRTSSTGITNGHAKSGSVIKPVLRPVSEGSWMAQGKTLHTSVSDSSPPASDPPRDIGNDITHSVHGTMWSREKEKIIMGPYDYMVDHPGKDIRKQMISAFNAWLHVPEESLAIIAKVVTMLHTASLLVDDVEDSSVLRRGVPVAHSIFGTAQTINSANYVYFRALREIQKLSNPEAINIFTEELLNLHRGQGMDLFWRDTLTCPSEEDYLEMVGNKTGGLFRLAIKLMQAESESSKNCIPLVNLMGLMFQIRDDYLNLSDTDYAHNKGLCEDLTEGKFSFPIIHSIRSNTQNLQLINILKQRTTDEEVKKYAVSYMEKTGSFGYCRKTLSNLREKAVALIDELDAETGEGRGVRIILDKFSEN